VLWDNLLRGKNGYKHDIIRFLFKLNRIDLLRMGQRFILLIFIFGYIFISQL